MKKRYSEEHIIKAIKRHDSGVKVEEISRELGISIGWFCNWRSKEAGLEVTKLKPTGAENREQQAHKAFGRKGARDSSYVSIYSDKKW